jgi:hypothetical protein
MDPLILGPEQWAQIDRALVYLFLFVGLAVNTGLSFLLGHAVIPSLAASADVPAALQSFRRVLYPVSLVSLLLTLYALAQAIILMVPLLQQLYPRFWI